MIKSAIYCRVSTQRQEREATIESQVAELKDICKRDKVQIVKEYIDNGWSGATLARPALDQLRDDSQKGLFEILYIYSADRLGRDHIDQGLVLRELKKQGVKIIFKDKPLTEDNKLTFDIESLLAEHEKRKILERTRRGRLHKAKTKGILGAVAPYGWTYILKTNESEGYYTISLEESKTVNLIFDLYLELKNIAAVGRELIKRNIPTRQEGNWTRTVIRGILRNEAVIGNGFYNRRRAIEPKKNLQKYRKKIKSAQEWRNKSEWIPIKFPAILKDKTKFFQVQEILSKNKRFDKPRKHFYLLSGFLKCGSCQQTMIGETNFSKNKKFKYYHCKKKSDVYFKNHLSRCEAKRVRAEKLEKIVWNAVFRTLTVKKMLLEGNELFVHKSKSNRDKELLQEEITALEKEKTQIQKRKNKLFDLYESDKIERGILEDRIGDYSSAEKEIKYKLKEIKDKQLQLGSKSLFENAIKLFCSLNRNRLVPLTQEQKRTLLKGIVSDITFCPDTGQVKIEGEIQIETGQEKKKVAVSPFRVSLALPYLWNQNLKQFRFRVRA